MQPPSGIAGRTLSWLALLAFSALAAFAVYSWDSLSDGQWIALLGGGWLLAIIAVLPRLPRPPSSTGRGIVNTAFVLTSIFAVIAVQLVRVQIISSDEIQHRVGRDETTDETLGNPRLVRADLIGGRGSIVDREEEVVAESRDSGGSSQRVYPDPATGYVAGYYSPLLYGKTGLESSYDEELRGEAGGGRLREAVDDLLGREPQGNDLVLTLDADLQTLAHELLDGRAGAVVVLDVKTGAVLTLASNPNFDPNELDVLTEEDRDAAIAYWDDLTDDPSRPLVLRATQGLFTPGSTFKVITAAAAIDTGKANPETVYQDDGSLNVAGHLIVEQNRPDDTVERWTLADGIAFSLNVVLAQVGLDLGAERLREYAERFGFEREVPFDLPVSESRIASSEDFLDDDPALADTAFGQGQLQVTPLLMALAAAAIANGGIMMEPFLVDHVQDQDGNRLSDHDPRRFRQPISTETAAQVQQMMINAVENGYVGGARVEGFVVGGKTGTAEVGDDEPHSWFIGFVGDPEPRYAVAVVLEHGGVSTAAPVNIGREMLYAAMREE